MIDEQQRTFANFHHMRNIEFGRARIIFSPERGAWALPGRRWTTDYDVALQVARDIDERILRAQGRRK